MKKINYGDTILVEKGMIIFGRIPEKFVNPNKPLSSKECYHSITVGEIYEQKLLSKEELIEKIKLRTQDFLCLEDSQIENFIDANPNMQIPQKFDSSCFEGEYTVDYIELTVFDMICVSAERNSPNGTIKIKIYLSKEYYPVENNIVFY